MEIFDGFSGRTFDSVAAWKHWKAGACAVDERPAPVVEAFVYGEDGGVGAGPSLARLAAASFT